MLAASRKHHRKIGPETAACLGYDVSGAADTAALFHVEITRGPALPALALYCTAIMGDLPRQMNPL